MGIMILATSVACGLTSLAIILTIMWTSGEAEWPLPAAATVLAGLGIALVGFLYDALQTCGVQ